MPDSTDTPLDPEKILEELKGTWLGPRKLPGDAAIKTWIKKALREISRQVPDLPARVLAESLENPPRTDLAALAADVAVDVLTRKFQNPEGLRSHGSGTGPFSKQKMYGGDSPGRLELDPKEIEKLKPPKQSRFGTVSLIPSTARGSRFGPPDRLVDHE